MYMSMPPQSASSHHIPSCLYAYSSSQLCAGPFLSVKHHTPPNHLHLRPFNLWLQLCPHGLYLPPEQQAASNAYRVNVALHPHRCYHIIILRSHVSTSSFLKFLGSSTSGNADFQKAAPQISQLLEMLRSSRQQLTQLWHSRKAKLEQCFQLRIFEADIEKVWVVICSGTIHHHHHAITERHWCVLCSLIEKIFHQILRNWKHYGMQWMNTEIKWKELRMVIISMHGTCKNKVRVGADDGDWFDTMLSILSPSSVHYARPKKIVVSVTHTSIYTDDIAQTASKRIPSHI